MLVNWDPKFWYTTGNLISDIASLMTFPGFLDGKLIGVMQAQLDIVALEDIIPDAQCMVYLPTFTTKTTQM